MDIIITILVLVVFSFIFLSPSKSVIKTTKARAISDNNSEIQGIVSRLSKNANLKEPNVYIIPSQQPNAFAFGYLPFNASIGLTEGLLKILNRHELEGVVGHELAHIRNYDTLIHTTAAMVIGKPLKYIRTTVGACGIIAKLPIVIFTLLASLIMKAFISRKREYEADKTGAIISNRPKELANALLKMQKHIEEERPLEVNEMISHMCILNPLSGRKTGEIFNTHPPVEKRIEKLKGMEL